MIYLISDWNCDSWMRTLGAPLSDLCTSECHPTFQLTFGFYNLLKVNSQLLGSLANTTWHLHQKSTNIHHLASASHWAAPTFATIYRIHTSPYPSSIWGWDAPDHVQPILHTFVTEGPMAKSSSLHCLLLGGWKGGRQIPKNLSCMLLYRFEVRTFEKRSDIECY